MTVTDLDLTVAIAAAEKALRADKWLSIAIMSGTASDVFREGSKLAVEAALPLIREQLAREIEGARVHLTLAKKTDRKLIHELLSMLHGFHVALVRGGTAGGQS